MSADAFHGRSLIAPLIFSALCLCSFATPAAAQPWPVGGKVIHVEDGDTLTILQSDYSKVSVRLSDIDAPETSHGRGRPGQHAQRRAVARHAGARGAADGLMG